MLVRALFTTAYNDSGAFIYEKDLLPADDPLVQAHPEWFSEDLEPLVRRTGPAVPEKKMRRTTATQELEVNA